MRTTSKGSQPAMGVGEQGKDPGWTCRGGAQSRGWRAAARTCLCSVLHALRHAHTCLSGRLGPPLGPGPRGGRGFPLRFTRPDLTAVCSVSSPLARHRQPSLPLHGRSWALVSVLLPGASVPTELLAPNFRNLSARALTGEESSCRLSRKPSQRSRTCCRHCSPEGTAMAPWPSCRSGWSR